VIQKVKKKRLECFNISFFGKILHEHNTRAEVLSLNFVYIIYLSFQLNISCDESHILKKS
jgi:hypothetical protein